MNNKSAPSGRYRGPGPLVALVVAAVVPTLTALLCSATSDPAKGTAEVDNLDCPDQGVARVASQIHYGPIQSCGVGLTLRIDGIVLQDEARGCPIFAVYEPVHYAPAPKAGYFTTPNAMVPITLVSLQCTDRWLFGFIPISIGQGCDTVNIQNAGGIETYVEESCDPRFRRTSSGNISNTPGEG